MVIYTIGHGRLSPTEIKQRLDALQVNLLVDVRTYPSSKRNPLTNRSNFESVFGSRYVYLGNMLGGFKTEKIKRDWPKGMKRLIALAQKTTVAIMCSESMPTDCHRQTEIVPELYDRLGKEVTIVHIMPDGALRTDRSRKSAVQEDLLM